MAKSDFWWLSIYSVPRLCSCACRIECWPVSPRAPISANPGLNLIGCLFCMFSVDNVYNFLGEDMKKFY